MADAKHRLAPKGIAPTDADVGRKVVYRTAPNFEPEEGVITSIGRIGNTFVRYGASQTSQSTDNRDLDWMLP